jgi:argininosuccinate lyase
MKSVAMAVVVVPCLTSFLWAQNENWMSEVKADQESLERLLEHTQVKKVTKRIDAAYEPSGYTWINTAWAVMLMKQRIVPEENAPEVGAALLEFWNSPAAKGHTDARAFQNYFNNKLGAPVAGNMTIGRVLPSNRMEIPVRRQLLNQMTLLYGLQQILLDTADKHKAAVMPGYTHNRHAQPTTLGHYLVSVYDPIEQSLEGLERGYRAINRSRLGCGALAGTSLPIDRELVATYLGMDGLIENTNYAVASSDAFVIVVADLTNIMAVLSRLAWDFDMWSTNEFDFIDFEVGVGSFMMPQKWAERANQGQIEATWFGASKILANLTEVASMGMKVPHGDTNALEYHMKDGTLAALSNIQQYAKPWLVLLASMQVHEDKMLERARSGYSAATELANELVRREGLDYRTAHDVVQTFTLESVRQGLPSSEAEIDILQAAAREVVGRKLKISQEQLREALDPVHFVNVTKSRGGVAPEEVARMIRDRRARLAVARERHLARIEQLEDGKTQMLTDLQSLCAGSRVNGAQRRLQDACATAFGSISTRVTSNPTDRTSPIADRIASSNDSASRWK